MHGHRLVIGIAAFALCVWCGWVSGFHRTTTAAEVTWVATVVAVMACDVALWRGRKAGRLGRLLDPTADPWPRRDRGGSGPALRGVAPWVALAVIAIAWDVLGLDTGQGHYHLTISALAQASRPLNAALLLVWVLVGIGYEVALVRAPVDHASTRETGAGPTETGQGSSMAAALAPFGGHHGAPALLLPQIPALGVAFWVAVPLVAVLVDVSARHSEGRRANAEEFVRFISTSLVAQVALIVAWGFAGYHLFAR